MKHQIDITISANGAATPADAKGQLQEAVLSIDRLLKEKHHEMSVVSPIKVDASRIKAVKDEPKPLDESKR